MVKVLFPNASLKQSQEVEVSVGDFVSISEYDVALIEGIVSEITAHEIKVKSATFVSGAYPQCDYSALENLTEYTFLLTDVCDIKTNANLRSPVDYLHKVIADNATKVKEFIVSPLFKVQLNRFLKQDVKEVNGVPVTVDKDKEGIYFEGVSCAAPKDEKDSWPYASFSHMKQKLNSRDFKKPQDLIFAATKGIRRDFIEKIEVSKALYDEMFHTEEKRLPFGKSEVIEIEVVEIEGYSVKAVLKDEAVCQSLPEKKSTVIRLYSNGVSQGFAVDILSEEEVHARAEKLAEIVRKRLKQNNVKFSYIASRTDSYDKMQNWKTRGVV